MWAAPRLLLFLLVLPIGLSHAFFFSRLCEIPVLSRFFTILGLCNTPSPSPSPSDPPTPYQPPPSNPPTPYQPPPSDPPIDLKPSAIEGFKGIRNAYSTKKGIIEIDWQLPLKDEVATTGIFFEVFVALGEYDFQSTLKNGTTVEDLVTIFENESTFQYFKLSDTYELSVSTPYVGELHSLLTTAQKEGQYSSNTISKAVVASTTDPLMRDGVNVVGYFLPSSLLSISVGDAQFGEEHVLSFTGSVSVQAQNLQVGDYCSGFTSEVDIFLRRVVRITENTPDSVILRVQHVRLEEIFAELDIDSSFELSGDFGRGSGRRQLFSFGDFVNVVKGAGTWFGDRVTEVGQAAIDAFDFIIDPEKTVKYDLVNLNENVEFEFLPKVQNFTHPASLKVEVEARVEVSLYATLRLELDFQPIKIAKVGAKAGLFFGASLTASVGVGEEYEESFDLVSRKFKKPFAIGPVPMEIFAEPKLTFDMSASASLEVSATTGFSVEGGTEVGLSFEKGRNPEFKEIFVSPDMKLDHILPSVKNEASFEAGAGLSLIMDVGIDVLLVNDIVDAGGLIGGNVGVRAEIDLEVSAALSDVDGAVIPTVNAFDLGIGVSIPLSGKALYGAITLVDTTIWEKTWPIITLPSIELNLLDEHRCLLGSGGAVARFSLEASHSYPGNAWLDNDIESSAWSLYDSIDGWSMESSTDTKAAYEKRGLSVSSPEPRGTVSVVLQPRFPPFLKIVETVSLDSFFPSDSVPCTEAEACDGDTYFDKLVNSVGAQFNSQVFLSQPPDPSAPLVPSTVYKFEDFIIALKKLQSAGASFQFWLGDDCSADSSKAALVNMAAFLGQAMRETIIYDACDENNWDKWRADIPKAEGSPPENLAALYPMSSGCGQLGQKYAEYPCDDDDECPQDFSMELTATTNARWIGAPPPLICGPKSKYNGLGYWNPQQFCKGADQSCEGEPFFYQGQTAGIHVPVSEDNRFPEFFYTNPLPDADGNTPNTRDPKNFPATNVEGCCWWGRGVIQTTGRCNFGKLNKQVGAGAGPGALYPEINFCQNPQAICTGPSDLKWIAGIFFWVTEPQRYNADGFNYLEGVRDFVARGCAEMDTDLTRTDCDFLFENASGIVNRGCHNPQDGGCPECVEGATCDPAHNVPERVEASKLALRTLLGQVPGPSPTPPGGAGTCGASDIGNGICADTSNCCSEFGFCDTTEAHCNPATCWSGPGCPRQGLPAGGTCGDGEIGDGICADSSNCCSEFGFCDTTEAHCNPATCWSGPGCPRNGV